ncbi:MAG: hypothetical protein ACRD20_20465 [Terriglobales bacterium]
MKLRTLFFFSVLLAASLAVGQQAQVSGSITGTGCSPAIDVSGKGIVGISVTGTWSGTIQPEVAVGGDAAVNTKVTPDGGGTAASTITANGGYQSVSVAGKNLFQLCGNTVTGTAVVKMNAFALSATSGSAGSLSPSAPVFWTGFGTGNASGAMAQNTVLCIGFVSGPYGGTYSAVSYDVQTADNTANVYDLGLADATTGARLCHIGPTAGTTLFPATGIRSANWAASCTLAPNTKYLVTATSSAASPAAKLGGNLTPSFQNGNTCGSSASGTIPDPLNTIPSDSYAQAPIPALALHN